MSTAPDPELHRPLAVAQIGASGRTVTVEADAAECAALARRMGIPAIHALSCRFRLVAGEAGAVQAEGELRARLLQDCVVSLEPFESELVEPFRLRFVPAAEAADAEEEDAPLDLEADDELPYHGGSIDLGEAVAEQLALALDPYPRKPGARLPDEAEAAPESPFAALARLRRPQ